MAVLTLTSFCLVICATFASIAPRGADPSNIHLYSSRDSFRCLDGSSVVSLDKINDDYCDCFDGSDEPGTAACPNGIFYCANVGYKPIVLPSSRVGDGVCDCCDGSDEPTGLIQCRNNCMVLGEELRVANEKKVQLTQDGFKIYLQYVSEGSKAKIEMKDKLLQMESEKELLELERQKFDEVKKEAEIPEDAAKNRHKLLWEESKVKKHSEKRQTSALKAFSEIDLNSDGQITVNEMQMRMEIDIDASGEVSYEEAMEYMEDSQAMDFPVFLEKIWDNIEQIFQSTNPPSTLELGKETVAPTLPIEEDDERNYNEEEDSDDNDHINEELHENKESSNDEHEQMPPYDEETQKVINAANEARSNLNSAESRLRNLQSQIEEARQIVEGDFGLNNEFYHLRNQCFELSDREYVYKLCPFEKAAQKNKNGGSETNLGRWSRWSESDSKYLLMLFENGQSCWNGPDRSTKVYIECGLINELISATEPNRCEYQFHFNTPAACNKESEHLHNTTPRQEL